jgi:DNA-binding transcriptional regulator YiaG
MGKPVSQESRDAFSAKLKAWRAANGITQKEAGERLGVPLKSIQNWEGAWTSPQGPFRAIIDAKLEPEKPNPRRRRR